jgi:hypothetical protein
MIFGGEKMEKNRKKWCISKNSEKMVFFRKMGEKETGFTF